MLFKYAEKKKKKLGWIKEQPSDTETTATVAYADKKSNLLATIGFALSFVCGLAGLPISAIACKRARKDGYDKLKMSTAGICVSVAWVAIFALCMIALACVLNGGYVFMEPTT